MLSIDGKSSWTKWGTRALIVALLSLTAFVAKTEDSRLNSRIDRLEYTVVTLQVTLGRLEEKLDAVRATLSRIEKKGTTNGQN